MRKGLWILGFLLALPPPASAHWCDTMWASVYNIVVRPASDSVNVSSGSSTQLQVWVQNNMGYPLGYPVDQPGSEGFVLRAEAPDHTIVVSDPSPPAKLPGFILPGEKLTYWLTITRDTAGSGDLSVEQITFYIHFGDRRDPGPEDDQDRTYGWADVMIKKTTGEIYPPRSGGEVPGLMDNSSWSRSQHLISSGHADYGVLEEGLAALAKEYCGGKATWASGNPDPIPQYCPDDIFESFTCPRCPTEPSDCPANITECRAGHCVATGAGYAYTYESLMAAGEVAYRGIRPGVMTESQLAGFRDQLMCGFFDDAFPFKAYATFILGYLGHDGANGAVDCAPYGSSDCDGVVGCVWSGSACQYVGAAFDFLDEYAVDGNPDTTTSEEYICRAALYMMDAVPPMQDGTPLVYADEMDDCMVSGDSWAEMICAGAVQIRSTDVSHGDSVVEEEIIARVSWTELDVDFTGIFAGHVLNLLAWRQRGWAVDAGDTGSVSFYEDVPDNVAPAAPEEVSCTTISGDTVRVTWQPVTLDEEGEADVVTDYRVYFGTTSNTCDTCTRPGMGFDYDHVGPNVSTTWHNPDPADLIPGSTTYFAVIAIDARGNIGQFSEETSCVVPTVQSPPVADIVCTPAQGSAPLTVHCDATGSSDPNGDIATTVFRAEGQDITGTTLDHTFLDAGRYTITVTVTDATGLWSTADFSIRVDSTGEPPTAVAETDATSGYAPLEVAFSSASSSDSDGTIESVAWDFDDGESSTDANPIHTFATEGVYYVELTVTDNDGLPATDTIRIDVVANNPPDLSSASAQPMFGPVPLEVHFDATGVFDPDDDDFTVEWDFADAGATSSDASPDYTYANIGLYDVVLTGEDEFGATATRHIEIIAGNSPPDTSAATLTPASGRAPLTVTVDASGCTDPDGDNLTFSWTAPGDSLDVASGELVLAEPGSQTVTLRVTDDGYPSITVPRQFTVEVTGDEGSQIMQGQCGCEGATAMGWSLLVLLGVALRRRR